MASTSVDLDREGAGDGRRSPDYRNDSFCAALELAVAAAHELDAVPVRIVPAPRPPGRAGLDERVQRDAIVRLRTGATANPGLLPLLAEGRFTTAADEPAERGAGERPRGRTAADVPAERGVGECPRGPGDRGSPSGEPGGPGIPEAERERADAVERALAVPDLLCLLSPPGAALTLAVAEIVGAAAERGERVLVAAPDPAAADPIVSRLPAGRTLIRIDQAGGGPGTLVAAAAEVQQRILARSQAAVHRLEAWVGDASPARGWLRRLTDALAEAAGERERADRAAAAREATAREVRERLGAPVREQQRAVEAAEQASALAGASLDRLTATLRRAESSPFGRFGRSRRARMRVAAAEPVARAARAALAQAREELAEREERLAKAVEQDGAVRSAADRAAFADLAAHRALESAERSAHQLTRLLDGVCPEPAWTADAAGLAGFAEHCHDLEPVLRGRALLLREWRRRAARPSRQLHAELLRYADVVAGDCLDPGRPEYGELEFDLVVIVDAGRVPLPVALVALARARRAVLAGEVGRSPLRVLPPGWVPDEVAALLTESVLERLAARVPAADRVCLGARL